MTTELERILQVPEVTRDFYRGAVEHFNLSSGAGQLWDVQACALASLAIHGGVALQAGCGDGKTLVSILGAVMVNAQRPLILIPGKLRSDFYRQWGEYAALGFRMPTNVEVKAHDFISRNSTWLDNYAPDYLFIDEGHNYRRVENAARVRRLQRYLAYNPTRPNGGDITFGVASGTLAADTVLDFAHLLSHALGVNCPVPRRMPVIGVDGLVTSPISPELARWANCLDVDGRPSPHDWNRMRDLVSRYAPDWIETYERGNGTTRQTIARQAYDERRRTIPGLITSDSESVSASLVITTSDEPTPPHEILDALDMVAAGLRPDGQDAFESDVDQWRAGQQVSIGVFYRWDWTRTELGVPDVEWINARKVWNKAVRHELANHAAPNYDSPGQISATVERDIVQQYQHGTAPTHAHLHSLYAAWHNVRGRHNPDELREHVWLHRWYVEHVVAEARRDPRPVIVWYTSEAMEDALIEAGLPCFGAGSEAPRQAITCGLSRRRFGTGHNLQDRWYVMHFAEFPSSGEAAEQTLARLHRPGQRAEVVEARVYTHTKPFAKNLERARQKAAFIQPMQGRQRLTYCPIVPLHGA